MWGPSCLGMSCLKLAACLMPPTLKIPHNPPACAVCPLAADSMAATPYTRGNSAQSKNPYTGGMLIGALAIVIFLIAGHTLALYVLVWLDRQAGSAVRSGMHHCVRLTAGPLGSGSHSVKLETCRLKKGKQGQLTYYCAGGR